MNQPSDKIEIPLLICNSQSFFLSLSMRVTTFSDHTCMYSSLRTESKEGEKIHVSEHQGFVKEMGRFLRLLTAFRKKYPAEKKTQITEKLHTTYTPPSNHVFETVNLLLVERENKVFVIQGEYYRGTFIQYKVGLYNKNSIFPILTEFASVEKAVRCFLRVIRNNEYYSLKVQIGSPVIEQVTKRHCGEEYRFYNPLIL